MNQISSQAGRVFVNGKETVDPLMIGYAILDAIESGHEIKITKDNAQVEVFQIKDIVYLKHDAEQLPRMITSINITDSVVMYEVISGIEVSTHYGFELSKEKIVF